jgi:DNA-binding transcriptional MerR regulator
MADSHQLCSRARNVDSNYCQYYSDRMAGRIDRLTRHRDEEFTLERLVETAARELHGLGVRSDDGRVAAVPDERSVRFYQTTGLVDRPMRYDGRKAIYGYRHLLQVLAVKRLQQEGQPLALIQRALTGRTFSELEQALGLVAREPVPPAQDRAEGAGVRGRQVPTTVTLIKADLGPGIVVTIDPSRVEHHQEVLARLYEFVSQLKEERR